MARYFLSILVAFFVPAMAGAGGLGPVNGTVHHWKINANGIQGSLDLAAGAGGRITGKLLGRPVEGWLVGRRLVLIRENPQGRETWEAWLATPENVHGNDLPILAGTFLRPGEEGPLPWWGATSREPAGKSTALPVPPSAGSEPATVASPPAHPVVSTAPPSASRHARPAAGEQAPPPTPPAIAPRLPSGQPSLAGTWETPDGPLTIRQDGSRLTFVLPDREVPGRLTGPDTLIGGFGPGCCKGHLEQAFAIIKWDNGVRWYRK